MDINPDQKIHIAVSYVFSQPRNVGMVAEDSISYGKKDD